MATKWIRAGYDNMIKIDDMDYHRNGVTGDPFWVVLFTDKDNGPMVAIVFDLPNAIPCAVLQRDLLAEGNITFGENSWRGDSYHKALMGAIKEQLDRERRGV